MTNKALFSIIIILLTGILSVSAIHAYNMDQDTSVIDDVSSSLQEAGEEIRDEIDDHTDAR